MFRLGDRFGGALAGNGGARGHIPLGLVGFQIDIVDGLPLFIAIRFRITFKAGKVQFSSPAVGDFDVRETGRRSWRRRGRRSWAHCDYAGGWMRAVWGTRVGISGRLNSGWVER